MNNSTHKVLKSSMKGSIYYAALKYTDEFTEKYPGYKVVNSKGHLSHKYAFGSIEKQKEKLEADGIEVLHYKVDLKKYQWKI